MPPAPAVPLVVGAACGGSERGSRRFVTGSSPVEPDTFDPSVEIVLASRSTGRREL